MGEEEKKEEKEEVGVGTYDLERDVCEDVATCALDALGSLPPSFRLGANEWSPFSAIIAKLSPAAAVLLATHSKARRRDRDGSCPKDDVVAPVGPPPSKRPRADAGALAEAEGTQHGKSLSASPQRDVDREPAGGIETARPPPDDLLLLRGREHTFKPVTLATGSRCVGAPDSERGRAWGPADTVVADQHSEVLAVRSLRLFLLECISAGGCGWVVPRSTRAGPSDGKCDRWGDADPNREPQAHGDPTAPGPSPAWKICDGIEFFLFTSEPPCGDASVRVIGNDVMRTGARPVPGGPQDSLVPGPRYHTPGVLRTKPGRGHATRSMSCSDKVAMWARVGLQGALLSSLVGIRGVPLAGIVVGLGYDPVSLRRAITRAPHDPNPRCSIVLGVGGVAGVTASRGIGAAGLSRTVEPAGGVEPAGVAAVENVTGADIDTDTAIRTDSAIESDTGLNTAAVRPASGAVAERLSSTVAKRPDARLPRVSVAWRGPVARGDPAARMEKIQGDGRKLGSTRRTDPVKAAPAVSRVGLLRAFLRIHPNGAPSHPAADQVPTSDSEHYAVIKRTVAPQYTTLRREIVERGALKGWVGRQFPI